MERREELCKALAARCPPVEKAYERLREKARLAHAAHRDPYMGRPRLYIADPGVVANYASQLYGRLQTSRLDQPPPPPQLVSKILVEHTVPGLLSCIYAYYYCSQGLLYNEFMTVSGPGGYGKSTLAVLLAMTLGGYVFTREDDVLRGLMRLLARNMWTPILVFDDIAAIISKYWYMTRKERTWRNFFKMLEYAKDIAAVVLVTTRHYEGQAKRFRELSTYRGEIRRLVVDSGERIVDVLAWYGGSQKTPLYIDVLWPGLRLPQDVWNRMLEMRRLRSRMLVIETLLDLHEAGEIPLSNPDQLQEELEKIKTRLLEL